MSSNMRKISQEEVKNTKRKFPLFYVAEYIKVLANVVCKNMVLSQFLYFSLSLSTYLFIFLVLILQFKCKVKMNLNETDDASLE